MASLVGLQNCAHFPNCHAQGYLRSAGESEGQRGAPGGKPAGVEGDEQMIIGMYKSSPDLHLYPWLIGFFFTAVCLLA
jgi:hypothetical protein